MNLARPSATAKKLAAKTSSYELVIRIDRDNSEGGRRGQVSYGKSSPYRRRLKVSFCAADGLSPNRRGWGFAGLSKQAIMRGIPTPLRTGERGSA